MKMKKKFMKTLAMSMAFSMLFSTNAFATPIDVANSEIDVKTDTLDKSTGTDYFADEENEWLDGTINEEVRVTVDLASQFEITIPKEIVLNGEDGTAQYKVKAVGDIAGDQKLSVVPDPDFVLSEAGGKADVTAIVTQPDTEYVYTDLQGDGTEYDGNIQATLTAGEWEGRFYFNINLKPDNQKTLEEYSWAEIAEISEAGEATNYFAVGDTKLMTLSNGETYNAQIIGFNHDDLADGSGKAGITFQFKELLTEKKAMHSDEYNRGGWESSEMRTYVNNDVYNLLPSDLQTEIKEVNKLSNIGHKETETLITTVDKLFLLSSEETSSKSSFDLPGQGTEYEFYSINELIYKSDLNYQFHDWWTRSMYRGANGHTCFRVGLSSLGDICSELLAVTPAFCI